MRVRYLQTVLLAAVIALGCTDRGSRPGATLPDGGVCIGSNCSDVSAPIDATTDETAPEASFTVAEKFTCISDWPTQQPAAPAPSLDVPRLALLGIDKSPITPPGDYAVFSAGRIAFSGGNGTLLSYNVSARTYAQQYVSCSDLGEPAIRRDRPGGFVAGCTGIVGLFPDMQRPPGSPLGPDDGVEWGHPLGPNKYEYLNHTCVAPMLVDPDGILYFTATDGSFKAISPSDGKTVWSSVDATMERDSGSPSGKLGIGDRLFFGNSAAFKRSTGTRFTDIMVDGVPVSVQVAAYSHRLIGEARVNGNTPADLVVVDECGNMKWSLGKSNRYEVLVGFDDSIVVGEYKYPTTPAFYRYSIDGELLAGPAKFGESTLLALGADDVLYLAGCARCSDPCDHDFDLEVIAVSESMEVLDRINVGSYCTNASAVLLDDGLMVVMRVGKGATEFVRIQTASPGLARTAWPTIRRDNERTAWVAPW